MKLSTDEYEVEYDELSEDTVAIGDFDVHAKSTLDVVDHQVLVNGGHWTVAAPVKHEKSKRTDY